VTAPDDASWRDALVAMRDPAVTAVLTVQCAVDWLRPEAAPLRDEIDEAITALALARPAVRTDRIVLHNLPAVGDIPAAELDDLNRAHADWLYRLALTGAMLPDTARPRVHRLIVRGGQRTVETVDGMELQLTGTWAHPDAAEAALAIVHRAGGTTPLTGYDVDLDGPFGDTDPSVYL
jgi:hypothetical protein